MATETTVKLCGEGGVEWTLALPLSEAMLGQVETGALQPVDQESVDLLNDYLAESEGWQDDGDEPEDAPEVKVSPAAAKLAEELGVDLSDVEGTGSGGSITKGDVENAAEDSSDEDDGDEPEDE